MNKLAVTVVLMVLMMLGGCTSIITYIKEDNRHDNANCEADDGSQGVFDVNGECTIIQPGGDNKNEAT